MYGMKSRLGIVLGIVICFVASSYSRGEYLKPIIADDTHTEFAEIETERY